MSVLSIYDCICGCVIIFSFRSSKVHENIANSISSLKIIRWMMKVFGLILEYVAKREGFEWRIEAVLMQCFYKADIS